MRHHTEIRALSTAWDRLTAELFRKREELERRETSQGTSHDPRKMTKLRQEIASLERRLNLCETLLEGA